MNFLGRVRKICLALTEAHEKVAWGAPTFRVRNKQFAMFLNNHHGDGRIPLRSRHPAWTAVGMGLVLQAGVLLVFDLFAEHRALVYTRWLTELSGQAGYG